MLLTNNPNSVISVEDHGRLGKSDHIMIIAEINCKPSRNTSEQYVPNWSKANTDLLKQQISDIDWKSELQNLDTNGAWNFFTTKLDEAVKCNVPFIKRRSSNQPMWMNRKLLRQVRKRKKLYKKYRDSRDHASHQSYEKANKEVQKDIKKAKKAFEKKLSNKDTGNKRLFNSYLKSKLSNKPTIGPLKNSTGDTVSEDSEMA